MNFRLRPLSAVHQCKQVMSAAPLLADIPRFPSINCWKVLLPNGETAKPKAWNTKTTPLQLALARGHRWLAMLESGKVKSLKEIAERENIDNSYVSRMVNLTSLSPDIVEIGRAHV